MLDSIPSFARLVAELANFPGIGNKTATRLAFFLLRQPDAEAAALATAIVDLKRNTRFCSVCYHITEQDPCPLCADPVRDGFEVVEEFAESDRGEGGFGHTGRHWSINESTFQAGI